MPLGQEPSRFMVMTSEAIGSFESRLSINNWRSEVSNLKNQTGRHGERIFLMPKNARNLKLGRLLTVACWIILKINFLII